jgi:hypothetical protein
MQQRNTTIFRLKTGKKQGTYSLKQGVAKKDGILKSISYRPGTSSIYDEDNSNSVAKVAAVRFKYNGQIANPHVEIRVNNADGLKLLFLKSHQKFNIDYEIFDADVEALKDAGRYDLVEKALGYVNSSDHYEIQASALAVFGFDHFSKSVAVCTMELKEQAFNNPVRIISVYEAQDFNERYVTSLMFCHGVIKHNASSTAIVWADTEGVIVHVLAGESGIDNLTSFLHKGSDQAVSLMQSFSLRVDDIGKKAVTVESQSEEISAKDKEIAELKKLLGEKQKTDNAEPTEAELVRKEYTEKLGKGVPRPYQNDLEWMRKKIAEVEE